MRRNQVRALARSIVPIGLIVIVTACGGQASTNDTSTGDATATTVTTVAGDTTTAAATVTKVNANTASLDEVAAALEAAGVSNADRWAREVLEYRPYDTSDPDLTHLREELAKYNPGDGVIDAIVSALEL